MGILRNLLAVVYLNLVAVISEDVGGLAPPPMTMRCQNALIVL